MILEFKDYREVSEELEMVYEGLFGNIGNWIRKKFKGSPFTTKLEELVGPEQIDQMIDQKTGDLNKEYKEYIDKGDIEGLFKKLEGFKVGQMWLQSIKFMKDGFMKADKESTMKVAGEKIGGTNDEAQLTQDSQDANAAADATKESLDKRAQEFDATYKKASKAVIASIKKQIEVYLKTEKHLVEDVKRVSENKKEKYGWVKPMFDTRLSSAELALSLLEYDIKKIRWNIEGLEPLKQEMAEQYKSALKFTKELDAAIKNADTEESNPADNLKELVTDKYNVGDEVDWFYADKTDATKKGNPAGKATILEFSEDVIKMQLDDDNGSEFNASYAIFRNWVMTAQEGEGIQETTQPTP